MAFNPNVFIGDVLTEAEVQKVFGCQIQLGIRLSKKNHAIVIVSDATPKNKYADLWDNDILYYTGTDAGSINGNQTLEGKGNNNGALKAVWDDSGSTTLFLFEKYATNRCVYKGVVRLVQEPYQELRFPNSNEYVWKFPLQLISVDIKNLEKDYEHVENKSFSKTEDELRELVSKKLSNPNRHKPIKRRAMAKTYDRDSEISAYVKMRAHGKCDLCEKEAPFADENNKPYLESHHITWLSRGGEDIPDNMVALCPNCHRKMHVLDLEEDKNKLNRRIKAYNKNS